MTPDHAGGDLSALRAVRKLTPLQRTFVKDGSIHGDFNMRTVYALRDKGLFRWEVDSPNGQWGFMRLTALGKSVQAHLLEQQP